MRQDTARETGEPPDISAYNSLHLLSLVTLPHWRLMEVEIQSIWKVKKKATDSLPVQCIRLSVPAGEGSNG